MPTPALVFGALGIPDDDYVYLNTLGQEAVFNATNQLLGNHNLDLAAFEQVFVERTTDSFKTRYYLETGGRMEKITNNTRPLDVKTTGQWDVAYPLEEFGARLASNRVAMAYMSSQQYGRHIAAILNSDVNTRRFAMLKALFNNAPPAFNDEHRGSLTIVPLANGDSVVYPPIVGSEDNATAQHYLGTTFAPTAIDDTHDPITPAVDLLEGHFGMPTGGSNVAVFLNKANIPLVQAMSEFNPIEMRFQSLGDNITQAVNTPGYLPGRTVGELGGKAIIQQWNWIPANYQLTVHLGAPRPLTKRVDDKRTGLPEGLTLLTMTREEPFRETIWTNRYGYAVGNRLNGVITFIDAGNAYVIPTQYA
jgi:hypothetical protein